MNSVCVCCGEIEGKHSYDTSKNACHRSLSVVFFSNLLYLVFNWDPGEFSEKYANENLDSQGICLSQK